MLYVYKEQHEIEKKTNSHAKVRSLTV